LIDYDRAALVLLVYSGKKKVRFGVRSLIFDLEYGKSKVKIKEEESKQ